ncbi:MAG: tetratricopeptide repeat protein [Bacteroidia bacterium]|nr:tetratricopeptide repeat protein [Bacteroidia bacterium]MCF8425406.1 tetratricopeptide repeat protein [Bacteroidia bacterium]
METIKKTILLCFLLLAINAHSQTLTEAFAKSYATEKVGNYKDAIAAIQTKYEPNSYEMNLRLGWLFYQDKKYPESISYYQKAKAIFPNSTEPLWGMIYPLSAQEKWNGVDQVYKDILKLDPTNSKANYYLGSIFYYRKDYNQAKKYFIEVVKLYPFDHDSNLLLAWCQYFLGNKTEAKGLFTRALLNQPTDASALEGLSLIK